MVGGLPEAARGSGEVGFRKCSSRDIYHGNQLAQPVDNVVAVRVLVAQPLLAVRFSLNKNIGVDTA